MFARLPPLLLCVCAVFAGSAGAGEAGDRGSRDAEAGLVLPLYPGAPPGSRSDPAYVESSERGGDGTLLLRRVSRPTLELFRPEPSRATGAAVVVCPGGSYVMLAYDKEGTRVARELARWGVTAAVLKYRLPSDRIMRVRRDGPLQDAQRALQLVRAHARDWGVDPHRVGIMGFSAGGHLAATASTLFAHPVLPGARVVDVRPDFSVLIYPVVSFDPAIAHAGSRDALVGARADAATVLRYSTERQVGHDTPPAFLLHAADDTVVPLDNSLRYARALQRAGVPVELHVYPDGDHGFGMRTPDGVDPWMHRLRDWMRHRGLLAPRAR